MSEQIRPCGISWAYCDGNCIKCNLDKIIYNTNTTNDKLMDFKYFPDCDTKMDGDADE